METEISRGIPVVNSSVFESQTDSQFALLMIDARSGPFSMQQGEFLGAAELRVITYLANGFVQPSQLDQSGTELDLNDERSAHLVLLERCDASPGRARVVGNMRLVVKDAHNPAPLPVETFFPTMFAEDPLPTGSVEVSRLIAAHEDRCIQRLMTWPLFAAGYSYVTRYGLGPVHGLLSPALVRVLQKRKVPVIPMREPAHIPAINATKQPVFIDLPLLGSLLESGGDQNPLSAAGHRCIYIEPGRHSREPLA